MKNYLKSLIAITIISYVAFFTLQSANNFLLPYILSNNEVVSVSSVDNKLKEIYPESHLPYQDLDTFIEGYDNLKHLSLMRFTQKLPFYAYTVTEQGYNGDISFIIVFDSSGYIQNLTYISSYESSGRGDFIESEEFIESILGQKAPYVNVDTVAGASISTGAMKRGITTASENFFYEVMRWKIR